MSEQQTIVQRFYAAFGEGDLDAATAVVAEAGDAVIVERAESPSTKRQIDDQLGLFTQLGVLE